MDGLTSSDAGFSVGWCPACGKEVLTHVHYDAAGAESRLCVHCDGPVDSGLRLATENELADKEYAVVGEQGCGRPDCGGGRCRTSL